MDVLLGVKEDAPLSQGMRNCVRPCWFLFYYWFQPAMRKKHRGAFITAQTGQRQIEGTMRKAILITLLLLTVGCTTPYQSEGWTGGYKDEKLGENLWRVSFLGNANRTDVYTWNAAMYRAAEIAQREGYRYFQVTQPSTEVFSRAYVNFTNLVSYKSELTMSGLK